MKTSLFTWILLCSTFLHAQYYDYTGKVRGLSIATSPIVSLHEKKATPQLNYYTTFLAYSQMLVPGVFPSLGYTYQRAYTTSNEYNRFTPEIPFNDGHQLNLSIEFRKCVLSKTYKVTSVMGCFFKRMGILLAPEYNYLYSQQLKNTSHGEFALKTGLYFYQGSTKINISKNIIYAVYYRKGFTPLITSSDGNNSFYRDEIGVSVCILFRELYRFGW